MKLHLGCGDKFLEGFIHVDIDEKDHIDFPKTDLRELPFELNSVDLIYSCGNLEYYDQEELPIILKEWCRVLKHGGILRLSVPNFDSIIKVYLNNGKNIHGEGILGPIFGKWKLNNGKYIYHKTVFNFDSLEKHLINAGFEDIRPYNHNDVMPLGFDDYSMAYVPYKDSSGIQISLNIEATKR